MILRAHPAEQELGAWFDGEGSERVGGHVVRCRRCHRHVTELARLRSWLRAQPFVAMGEMGIGESAVTDDSYRRSRRGPAVVVAALVVAFFLVADRSPDTRSLQSARGPMATGEDRSDPSPPAAGDATGTGAPGPAGPDLVPPGPAPAAPAPSSATAQGLARAREPSTAGPLRLGLIVPAGGSMAAEGREVSDVVRQRVAAANAAGGVAGLPVLLEVAAAEDPAAVASLVDRVDVLVGGFGAAPATDTPWLFPADPFVAGPAVVPAEMTPRAAGAHLGAVLRREGINGTVGVVMGSGPDAALAAGLASRAPTTTVVANEAGTCVPEMSSLFRSGAVVLAVAGSPDLASKCLRAAARGPWRPPYGVVLAPSAAYGGVHVHPESLGARTVLGLPWPTSMAPGAARFRSTTKSTSYRALVSYAATELAIDVARQQGTVSLAPMAAGAWRSDLFDLDGTTSRAPTIAVAFLGNWVAGR